MQFEIVRDALETIIEAGEVAGGYITVKSQEQQIPSQLQNSRVLIYYKEGDFPQGGGSAHGPNMHECTFGIDLLAYSPAKADVSVLKDPEATPEQRIAAFDGLDQAKKLGNNKWDALMAFIYQLVMDARNQDLGLTTGTVSSRWVNSGRKESMLEEGNLAIIQGSINFTLKVEEIVTGETPTPAGDNPVSNSLPTNGDSRDNLGVSN